MCLPPPASSVIDNNLSIDEVIELNDQLIKVHENDKAHMYEGRNVAAGNFRGLALETGRMMKFLKSDKFYNECFNIASNYSIVMETKLMNLFLILKYGLKHVDGDIIEFGSYKGGSAMFIANVIKKFHPQKKVYSLDTFCGMPETNKRIDMHKEGDFFDANLEAFQKRKEELNLDNLVIVPGKFEDTFPELKKEIKSLALVHIDCDIYSSVKYSIEESIKLMTSGYLCFDDPLHGNCLGAYAAVEDTLERLNVRAEQTYPHLVYRYPSLLGTVSP